MSKQRSKYGVLLRRDEGEECASGYPVLEAAGVGYYGGEEHDECVEESMVLYQVLFDDCVSGWVSG